MEKVDQENADCPKWRHSAKHGLSRISPDVALQHNGWTMSSCAIYISFQGWVAIEQWIALSMNSCLGEGYVLLRPLR
jgi:hypothetical protein